MRFLVRCELGPWQDFDVRAPLPDVLTGESGISYLGRRNERAPQSFGSCLAHETMPRRCPSTAGWAASLAIALAATRSAGADDGWWSSQWVGSALFLASAVPSRCTVARSSAWQAPVVGYLLVSEGFVRAAAVHAPYR